MIINEYYFWNRSAHPSVEITGTSAAVARVKVALAAIVAKFNRENVVVSLEGTSLGSSAAAKGVRKAVKGCAPNAALADDLRMKKLRTECVAVASENGAAVRPLPLIVYPEGAKRDYKRPAEPMLRLRGNEVRF
jgi:hypothetical protein